jgi:hypothetical protein
MTRISPSSSIQENIQSHATALIPTPSSPSPVLSSFSFIPWMSYLPCLPLPCPLTPLILRPTRSLLSSPLQLGFITVAHLIPVPSALFHLSPLPFLPLPLMWGLHVIAITSPFPSATTTTTQSTFWPWKRNAAFHCVLLRNFQGPGEDKRLWEERQMEQLLLT